MRVDQLARQWRVIRAIEASPNGLTVTPSSRRKKTGIPTINHALEAFQMAGFPLETERTERGNRWPFINPFKHKIPPICFERAHLGKLQNLKKPRPGFQIRFSGSMFFGYRIPISAT